MCGIIGCVGRGEETLSTLLHGLSKLEYRGYDSAGVALSNGRVDVRKCAGEIEQLEDAVADAPLEGTHGIGHTRWSTHGPPTDANAHPHLDCDGDVAVVHNGIIENYQSLRDDLVGSGHDFVSDTDTEVVPHLIEAGLADGLDPEDAFRRAVARLEGSYAVAAVVADSGAVFAARRDSPLVLGVDEDRESRSDSERASSAERSSADHSSGHSPREDGDEPRAATYIASDVPAFRDFTDRVVYLADGEYVRLEDGDWTVTDAEGEVVEKEVNTVEWDAEETGKSGYDHFMKKEIHEQPRAIRQCLSGRVDELSGTVDLADIGDLSPTGVQFVAAGTSYHAALFGARMFREAGLPAQAFLASEYATGPPPVGNSLVVGVTQSGETADTLSALREARSRGARTLAVTNVVGSTAARECDHALYIRAGPEIGVAATKTFASQLVALTLFWLATTREDGARETIAALRDLPGQLQSVLDGSRAAEVAEEYRDSEAYFFVGRGYHHPVALEGALKMKEITYKHAEGFAAGELKHGTLALVTEDTPVFAVVTGDDERARKTVGNVKEVEARDAPVIAVTDGESDVERYADEVLSVPETSEKVAPVLANAQLQLAGYHTARLLGRSIDKPRNLAKSVTVE